jgi:hypothetical protein
MPKFRAVVTRENPFRIPALEFEVVFPLVAKGAESFQGNALQGPHFRAYHNPDRLPQVFNNHSKSIIMPSKVYSQLSRTTGNRSAVIYVSENYQCFPRPAVGATSTGCQPLFEYFPVRLDLDRVVVKDLGHSSGTKLEYVWLPPDVFRRWFTLERVNFRKGDRRCVEMHANESEVHKCIRR